MLFRKQKIRRQRAASQPRKPLTNIGAGKFVSPNFGKICVRRRAKFLHGGGISTALGMRSAHVLGLRPVRRSGASRIAVQRPSRRDVTIILGAVVLSIKGSVKDNSSLFGRRLRRLDQRELPRWNAIGGEFYVSFAQQSKNVCVTPPPIC